MIRMRPRVHFYVLCTVYVYVWRTRVARVVIYLEEYIGLERVSCV